MKNVLLILLCLISGFAFSQRDLKTIEADFNDDGVIDTLKSFYEGGSGFGGKYVQITNGQTNEVYSLANEGCFCQIKHVIEIPPELDQTQNQAFLKAIKEELLPPRKDVPDASLDWIIQSSFSNAELDCNRYFDLVIDPQISWIESEFEFPQSYYIETSGDTLELLKDSEASWRSDKDAPKGILVYYGHNHYGHNHLRYKSPDSLVLLDSNEIYQVYGTAHGVLLKKGDLHKWVFISDVALTGAPAKLRWESIKMAQLLDNYIVVQQALPPLSTYQIFIINIESGICGKLAYDFHLSEDKTENFAISDHEFTFLSEGKQYTLDAKEIFEELESQYLAPKLDQD